MKVVFKNTTLKFEKGKTWEERAIKFEFNVEAGVGLGLYGSGTEKKIISASQWPEGKFAFKLVAPEGVLKQDNAGSTGLIWNYNFKSQTNGSILELSEGLTSPCKDGVMYIANRISNSGKLDTYLYIPGNCVLKNGKVTLYLDLDYKG